MLSLPVGIRKQARGSLSYFARHVLGVHLSRERCVALQAGSPPRTPREEQLWNAWQELRQGRVNNLPERIRWIFEAAA